MRSNIVSSFLNYQNNPYNNPYQNPYYNAPINNNGYQNGSGYYGGFSVPQQNSQQYNGAMSKEEAMRILYSDAPKTYSNEFNRDFNENKVRFTGENQSYNFNNDSDMISSPINKEEINPSFTFEDKSNITIFDEYNDE